MPYQDDSGDDIETNTEGQSATKKRKVDQLGPSCCSCRKRKAKCSRDQPCTTCLKIGNECVYDHEKLKPGMRTGAIENLNQRLSTLENMFVGQGVMWQQIWNSLNNQTSQNPGQKTPSSLQSPSLQQQSSNLRDNLAQLSSYNDSQFVDTPPQLFGDAQWTPAPSGQRLRRSLPPDDLVDSLVEIYFQQVHPWIPILHVHRFRACLANPSDRSRVSTILYAIVSLCIRFSNDPRLDTAPNVREWYATRCRQIVILESMDSFSVENLQAMTICAFDIIGGGKGPSAWSIVGSMARIVEQLGLSMEENTDQPSSSTSRVLIKRMAFLPPAPSWNEVEERRRVFWNVFLVDCFCSISTGWNLSLTSADIQRRLPCEGAIWESGEPLPTPTPYFGIANRCKKDENNCLPASREVEDGEASTYLGGFAYCIEATESLRLVTSFFLQYEVDFKKNQEVQRWQLRFKQLDLRLVQWKLFLPERWSKACLVNNDGNLDPNLVLAHMTHNTAVVLLHQGLAYPPPEWLSLPMKLPSASSAETCHAAAVEVATIATQFMHNSSILINPQFAFCLFVCGKMLLTHSAYYQTDIDPSYDVIITSLDEISRRWTGVPPPARANLASKFSARLKQARKDGANNTDIREAFSDVPTEKTAAVQTSMNPSAIQNHDPSLGASMSNNLNWGAGYHNVMTESPDNTSLAFPPLPPAFQTTPSRDADMADPARDRSVATDGAGGISDGFLDFYDLSDQPFLPSERVSILSRPYPESQ